MYFNICSWVYVCDSTLCFVAWLTQYCDNFELGIVGQCYMKNDAQKFHLNYLGAQQLHRHAVPLSHFWLCLTVDVI